jgi:hypothetical protein
MKEKISFYQLPKEASLLSNHLSRFRRLLNKGLLPPAPRKGFPEDEFFFSNVEMAGFIGCSVRTVRRLRQRGKIPCIKHGNVVLFHIATVLDLIAKDDKLAALFTRKVRPHRPKQVPKIRYSCTLKRGWVFVDIRYLGWKGTYICGVGELPGEKRLHLIIRQIVTARNSYKPFKTLSNENK